MRTFELGPPPLFGPPAPDDFRQSTFRRGLSPARGSGTFKRLGGHFEIMGLDGGAFPRRPARRLDGLGSLITGTRMRQSAGMATLGAWYDQLEAGVAAQPRAPEDLRQPVSKGRHCPKHHFRA